jgi:outer membrane protein assembly factor BamB
LCEPWGDAGPRLLWRREVGRGYSSPVVWGERLIVFYREGDEEVIECLSTADGRRMWRFSYPTDFVCRVEYTDGPYSTPALDGECAYAVGAEGVLHCLRLCDGSVKWRRHLSRDFHVPPGLFGVGASPLLEGERLILNVGGTTDDGRGAGVIALDKYDGRALWTAADHGASYATPRAATIHGRRFVFVFTDRGLLSLDPATGRVFGEAPFRTAAPENYNAASPLVDGDRILVTVYAGGALCLRVRPDGGFEELWRDRRALPNHFSTLIGHHGHVFGFSSLDWTLRCIDLSSGEVAWRWRSDLRRGQGLLADGKLLFLGEDGHLALLEASTRRRRVLAMTPEPILAPPCYAAPALSENLLFLRNEQEILCLNIRGKHRSAE